MPMHTSIQGLAGILDKQIKNYQELSALLAEERKAIIANDLKMLAEATSRIQLLVASNNQLEMTRMNLVQSLASELKLPTPKPTLAQIAHALEEPDSQELMTLRQNARAELENVRRQSHINGELLRYSANLVDTVLKRMVEPEPCEATYGQTGETARARTAASLLDQHM